ncbi:MaoC/PaaZ C-terminal domain-containing protein [Thalassotalea psychrophila]|uniref:MaoC/PaaZ C-terminal domain-containing protein n=1 Tax=Thalassotalea psychrophila TaxID=3065647 RepID=A0ABY9TX57_9GAMM|nr:MaoC/PaaZ C-terminal domain-containing protein [Colwelliaceae bacterium SQ149]
MMMYQYIKLLIKRPQRTFFNEFSVEFDQRAIRAKKITKFRELYNLDQSKDLPISYAFIAGFNSLLKTFSHKYFAFSPLGLIHLKSEFEKTFELDFRHDFKVINKVRQDRRHPMGKVIVIETQFFQNERCCLVNKNTFLKKLNSNKRERIGKQQAFIGDTNFILNLAKALAYAKVSNDFNPIHLNNKLANLFGLPNAIMHGGYLGHLVLIEKNIAANKVKFDFKKPCVLPCAVGIFSEGNEHQVFSGNDQLHLSVKVDG